MKIYGPYLRRDGRKHLLARSRNLLSHPPLWWKENEASRERLIGELDAAIHQPVSVEGKDMTSADIERLAREAGMWQDGDRWFTPGKSALDVSTAQLARFAALALAQRQPLTDSPWVQRQTPFTDSQIDAILDHAGVAELLPEWDRCGYEIARAIEAAHGIKERS
jgi:hypothetical protein